MIGFLIGAHLIGDFLLQNDWMQRKSKSTYVCTVHVLMYSIPFLALLFLGIIPDWLCALVLLQHWTQDRLAYHLKWGRLIKQTPPDKWPIGPLCNDQAMHIGFMWLCVLVSHYLT